ncbi:MATE family efflux transporter [Saccharothrix stipae]
MTAANRSRLDGLRALAGTAVRQSAVTIDQLVFSAITFAVQLVAAPVSTDAEFGVFSLVAIVQIGQWYLGRAVAAEPLLVAKAVANGDARGVRGAAATSLLLGLAIGAVCLVVGLLLDGPARTLLLIQALASPFTAVLDHGRYVSYARQRPLRALALDGSWLVLFLGAVGVAVLVGELDASSTYLIWALTAVPVAAACAWLTGGPFAVGAVRDWLRDRRSLLPGFLIDAVYLTAGTWATFGVTAWVVGLDGLGLLRKALVPVTALTVLFIGISNALLAHLAGRSAREVVRAPVLVSGLAAVVSLVFAGLTLVAPADLLTAALGTPWEGLRPVVLVLLAYAFLLATAQTALVAGKASGRAWLGPRVRTVQFATEIALVAGLGLLFGVMGVAFGMALAWLTAAALAWGGLLGQRGRA